MKGPRFAIAGLMAAVGVVAFNLAVIRSFDENNPNALPHLFFVCGVMPMASLLLLVALTSAPKLARGSSLSPFVLGFETAGWAVVFAYIACYSLRPMVLMAAAELVGVYTRPVFIRYFPDPPRWIGIALELGFGAVIFSLPQLVAALFGGWLNSKLGMTVRFERAGTYAAESILTREHQAPFVVPAKV